MRRFFYEIKVSLIATKDFFYKIFLISRHYTSKMFFHITNFFYVIFSFLGRFLINILTLPENIFYFLRFLFRKTRDGLIFIKDKVVYAFQGLFYLFEDFLKKIGRFFLKIGSLIGSFFKNLGSLLKKLFKNLGSLIATCIKRFYNIFLVIPIAIIFVVLIFIAIGALIYQIIVMLITGITNTAEKNSDSKLIYIRTLYNPSFGFIRAYNAIMKKMRVRKYSTIIDNDEHKYFVELSRKTNYVFFSIVGFIFLILLFVCFLPISIPLWLIEVTIGRLIIKRTILKRIVIKSDKITDNFEIKQKKFFGMDIRFIPSDEAIVSIDGIVNPLMKPLNLINGLKVKIACVINGDVKDEYEFEIDVDETNNELQNVYRKIELPSLITGNIDFSKYAYENISITWESLSPIVITNEGKIISDRFRMNNKVYFVATITKGNRYIRKNLSTSILIDDEEKIVKYYLEKLPKELSISRGLIRLQIPKYINVFFEEIDGVINAKGEVKEQKYGKNTKIKVTLLYNKAKKSSNINLHIGATKRGRISILSAIRAPKINKENYEFSFSKVITTKDKQNYQVRWFFPENAQVNETDNMYVLSYPEPRAKGISYKVKAVVSFDGKDYLKKFGVSIPSSSKNYMLRYEYDKLQVDYKAGIRWIYFPTKTEDYKCRIIWVSKNPEIISSGGKIRYKMLNAKTNNKDVTVYAYIFKRFHVIRKTFVFKIELPEVVKTK